MEQSPLTIEYGSKTFLKPVSAIEERGKKQTSEAVVRFPELASFSICVDDVKVSTCRVVCKPTCRWFQYHQLSF